MSKNNLRGIILGVRAVLRIHSLTSSSLGSMYICGLVVTVMSNLGCKGEGPNHPCVSII